MSSFDDSSDEMYNSDLSSSDAERLVCGEINSPADADLFGLMSEVRNLSSGTPTPKPGAALSEFVGVSLSTNETPVGTPDSGIDLRLTPSEPEPVTTRRNSVFAQFAAFAGTIGGKVALSGAVAAASISGAHATGMVDVPYLPDTAAEVETIDTELGDESVEVADTKPEALSFADDTEPVEEIDKPAVEENADKKDEPKHDLTDDLDKKTVDEKAEAHKAEERAAEEAKKAEAEKAEHEAEEAKKAEEAKLAEEHAKKEAAEKAELEAKKKAEAEAKDDKNEDDHKTEVVVAALEAQLHADKAAVRANARVAIEEYELKRKNKEARLASELAQIDKDFAGYVADIDAQIEATEDEQELAELREYRANKLIWWEEARTEREAAFAPYLAEIDETLEAIELERDAKIDALIAEFHKAVEAAKS